MVGLMLKKFLKFCPKSKSLHNFFCQLIVIKILVTFTFYFFQLLQGAPENELKNLHLSRNLEDYR